MEYQTDREHFDELIEDADKRIWITLVGKSASGLARYYEVYVVVDNEIIRITHDVHHKCGLRYSKRRAAIQMNGYGFSGVQAIADTISQSLYGDAKAVSYREL